MSVSLDDFVEQEKVRVARFKQWYLQQAKKSPTHYPLSLPDDNAGAWDEMLADFDEDSSDIYKLEDDDANKK
jgi:hypothetical protein